jgi:hypothetical protein
MALLVVLSMIHPVAGLIPSELVRLFRSTNFLQTFHGTAWDAVFRRAFRRADSKTLYRLRCLRNSVETNANPDASLVDMNELRARILEILLEDPHLSPEFAQMFRTMQLPLLNLEPLALDAVELYIVTHSVIPVVAARAIHRQWLESPDEIEAMSQHLHATLDAMFACISTEWAYFDTLADFVHYVECEFGASPN